jgi:hypothetical protein
LGATEYFPTRSATTEPNISTLEEDISMLLHIIGQTEKKPGTIPNPEKQASKQDKRFAVGGEGLVKS